MDWLSVIVAVLVFVLPPLLEKRRKMRAEHSESVRPPVMEERQDEVRTPKPVEMGQLYVNEGVRSTEELSVSEPEPQPATAVPSVSAKSVTRDAAPRAKRRFNARDMVIYSEILHPKYLEKRENL